MFLLTTIDGLKITITEEEATKIIQAIEKGGTKGIVIGKSWLTVSSINYIGDAEQILEQETLKARFKAGQWQCGYGFWHNFREECGHNLLGREEKEKTPFIGLDKIIRQRIENNEEEKTFALEQAEAQGKDVDWHKGEILSND